MGRSKNANVSAANWAGPVHANGSGTTHNNGSGPVRLDRWKEIAAYLDRDSRTVQLWEKDEGLPVHRHMHCIKASVYAYSEEIDAWLRSRSGEGGAADSAREDAATMVRTSDSVH